MRSIYSIQRNQGERIHHLHHAVPTTLYVKASLAELQAKRSRRIMKVFHYTCCDSNAVGKDLLIKATGCIHKYFDACALRPATLRDDQITGLGGCSPVHISQAIALTVFTNPKEVPCATRSVAFANLSTLFSFSCFLPRDR